MLAIVETLSDVPEDLKMEIATSEWYFNKIKEVGGLAVLPHPYWVTERTGTRNLSEQLLSIILKRKKFDAIELISRAHHLMDVTFPPET